MVCMQQAPPAGGPDRRLQPLTRAPALAKLERLRDGDTRSSPVTRGALGVIRRQKPQVSGHLDFSFILMTYCDNGMVDPLTIVGNHGFFEGKAKPVQRSPQVLRLAGAQCAARACSRALQGVLGGLYSIALPARRALCPANRGLSGAKVAFHCQPEKVRRLQKTCDPNTGRSWRVAEKARRGSLSIMRCCQLNLISSLDKWGPRLWLTDTFA